MLSVAMTLHYKELCDAALPGYEAQVAVDYSRWRASQAKAVSQLEASPDFKSQQVDAKKAFEQVRAQAEQAGGDQLRQQMGHCIASARKRSSTNSTSVLLYTRPPFTGPPLRPI
jgi:hypothetical protein